MKPISLISYSTFPPSGPSALHVCPHCGNVRFPPFPTHSHQENIKCSCVYINFLKFSWCAAAYNDTCTLRVGPLTDPTPIYTCSQQISAGIRTNHVSKIALGMDAGSMCTFARWICTSPHRLVGRTHKSYAYSGSP